MKKLVSVLVLCLCSFFALPALATDIVIGADTGSNYYPFGGYTGEYQQVYGASAFSGPITLTALQFFDVENPSAFPTGGSWTISLSTTSAAWNTLSSTFANNITGPETTEFTGDLSTTLPPGFGPGSTLTINLSTPFTYNPADGNLLLDVGVTAGAGSAGFVGPDFVGLAPAYFQSTEFSTVTGHVDSDGVNSGPGLLGTGLVTGFVGTPIVTTAAPEPPAIFLLASGLIALGLLLWKRPAGGIQTI